MPDKIFIVTSGAYSDFDIAATFSTEKKAEDYIDEALKGGRPFGGYDIHEYQLDRPNDWGYLIKVVMLKDGKSTILKPEWTHLPKPIHFVQQIVPMRGESYDVLNNWVLTDSKKRAVKSTNELRTQMIANGDW